MKQAVLGKIIEERKQGRSTGIPSYCTANEACIRAILRAYRSNDLPIIIEATANQVNQDGGYTGMLPREYAELILQLAQEEGISEERIILGGDHLGPLTWQREVAAVAMDKAHELLRLFCQAGFRKIHLDTSMRLGDDDPRVPLAVTTIARRGADLFATCIRTLEEERMPQDRWPEFIIGSEVPVPGGISGDLSGLEVTSPRDFAETVQSYQDAFADIGLAEYFNLVKAVVVQPGVEFADRSVHVYDRVAARPLVLALDSCPTLIFEGHSTDYQPLSALRNLVEDGVGILKVGPMLTNAYREGLYALSYIEDWLVPAARRSNVRQVLEEVMLQRPEHWQKYYTGDEQSMCLDRHFSYSDRIRYYLPAPEAKVAIQHLKDNLKGVDMPEPLIRQFLPEQWKMGLRGAEELLDAKVKEVVDLYEAACRRL
jgi:D-tagatose-1,6-bisphosphate aldolase subunit GatZ/KbaZ